MLTQREFCTKYINFKGMHFICRSQTAYDSYQLNVVWNVFLHLQGPFLPPIVYIGGMVERDPFMNSMDRRLWRNDEHCIVQAIINLQFSCRVSTSTSLPPTGPKHQDYFY